MAKLLSNHFLRFAVALKWLLARCESEGKTSGGKAKQFELMSVSHLSRKLFFTMTKDSVAGSITVRIVFSSASSQLSGASVPFEKQTAGRTQIAPEKYRKTKAS